MAKRIILDCEELQRLYVEQQMGTVALAHYYGCSPVTIAKRLRDCGVCVRPSRFQACYVSTDELRWLYEVEQLPIAEIAQRLGVSQSTIGNRRRELGIPKRPRMRQQQKMRGEVGLPHSHG